MREESPPLAATLAACASTAGASAEDCCKEREESQKLQARTLLESTAPHCEQVFVTDEFCAADASTPVRSEREKNSTQEESQAQIAAWMWLNKQGDQSYYPLKSDLQLIYASLC